MFMLWSPLWLGRRVTEHKGGLVPWWYGSLPLRPCGIQGGLGGFISCTCLSELVVVGTAPPLKDIALVSVQQT